MSAPPYHKSPSLPAVLRSRVVLLVASFFVVVLLFVYTPLPARYDAHRDAAFHSVWPGDTTSDEKIWQPWELDHVKDPKYAFVTLLTGDASKPGSDDDMENNYFVATRLLTYQLIHAPETASTRNGTIPFIVMVTKRVSKKMRSRLLRDGAIVHEVEDVKAEWLSTAKGNNPRYIDVMAKLRAWELTQFERICFLDLDTVLTQAIDGIFEDPAGQTQSNLNKADKVRDDEADQPNEYVFAARPETNKEHSFPPTSETKSFVFGPHYLNAGFMLFSPNPSIIAYYHSLVDKSDGRYGAGMPEQNLLNYAHRHDGNMPAAILDPMWNIFRPSWKDVEGGVKSLHEKFWKPEHEDLKPYLERWKGRAMGFYEARDMFLEGDYAKYERER